MQLKTSGTAKSVVMINGRPQDFRLIADQMDLVERNADSTRDHGFYEIAENVTVVWKIEKQKTVERSFEGGSK